MRRTSLCCSVLFVLAAVTACDGSRQAGGAEPHSHGEPGAVALTHWTDRTELFMEYPPLVAGESGRSAIHVTDLVGFVPLAEGEAIVTLRSAEGRVLQFRGGPSAPGIFGADLAPDRPGVYDMTLRIEAPGFVDFHELGEVAVRAPGETPVAGAADEGEDIAFLKEQQWTLEFGTAEVEVRTLRSSVTVPATVRPRAGGAAVLTAPVPGRIDPASPVPVSGSAVRAGDVLARIIPRSDDLRDAGALRAALVEAEQAHGLALRERDRVERLVEARALPRRRSDEARAALLESEARLAAARERWSRYESLSRVGSTPAAGTFSVTAPFDGVVAEVRFAPGAGVEDHEVLVRLVDPDRVDIVGAVPEANASELRSVETGELVLDDTPPVALARPLSVGRVVEPLARTTEVRFAFDNTTARLHVGQSVGLRLFGGGEQSGAAVPETAIIDDAGRPVVFVQTGGESFARRPVRLGTRAGGWVHVLDGVEPGERVVHVGAYLVRLAAMSTQIPSHGHVH